MRIRPAGGEDLAAMAALSRLAGVEGWSAAGLGDSLTPPFGRGWVAEEGGEVLGFVLARVIAEEAELFLIVVAEAARRRGLGRALWDTFEAALREGGAAEVFLEVADDNAPARAFYDGLGFTKVGRRSHYYASGADAVLMRRPV